MTTDRIPNCATCFHVVNDPVVGMTCVHNSSMYIADGDLLNAKLHKMQYHTTKHMREREDCCGKTGKLWSPAV
jgi:hypothetical protein